MKRRNVITLFGGAAVAWSSVAGAQTARKRPVIGTFVQGTPTQNKGLRFRQSFLDGLRELGNIEGRDFDIHDASAERPEDQPGTAVAVVNESFARKFLRGRDALGTLFTLRGTTTLEIVGVARDAKYERIREETPPMIYRPVLQSLADLRQLSIIVRLDTASVDRGGLMRTIRTDLEELEPSVQIAKMDFLDDLVRRSVTEERVAADLTSITGILALVLVSVGLYGMVAYAIVQRTRELGIRIALGAQREDLFRMVLRETLTVVIKGTLLGVPAALVFSRFASSKLFGVHAETAAAPSAAVSPKRGQQPTPSRCRVAQPIGRRQPDKRENRNHPQIVGKRGALVAPEERPRDCTGEPCRRRHRQAIELQIRVVDPVGDRHDGQDEDHPQHAGHAIGKGADHEEDNPFRPFHEADLALLDERLGAGARVARHDREDQRERRDEYVALAAE